MLKKIATDSLLYLFASIFNQLTGFVVVVLIMRTINVELYGIYSYANAIVALFSVIADGGISQYIVRQVNAGLEPIPQLYRRFQAFQAVVSMSILFALLFVAFGLHDSRESIFILLLGIGTVITGYLTTAFSFFIATGEKWIVFSRDIIFGIFRLLMVVIFINAELPLEYFCSITIIGQLAILAFVLVIRRRRSMYYILTLSWNFDGLGKLALAALPYTMLALVNIVYNKVDVIMLKRLSTQMEVGYYAGATQFVYPFMFVSSAVMTAIFPLLTRSLSVNSMFVKIHHASTLIMGSTGLIMSVFLYSFSPFIYTYFFSHKYNESLPIYQILVWYLALVFFYGGYSNTIIAKGGVRFLLALNLGMIIVNVTANYLIIPTFGAKGAAMVTIGCEFLILTLLITYYKFFIKKKIVAI